MSFLDKHFTNLSDNNIIITEFKISIKELKVSVKYHIVSSEIFKENGMNSKKIKIYDALKIVFLLKNSSAFKP